MYNHNAPAQAELPSTRQLLRSTLIAAATATALLITVVLPAEYAIDPTGIGRVLGLTEMGEIKEQLAMEAEQDAAASANASAETIALAAPSENVAPLAEPQPTAIVEEPTPVVVEEAAPAIPLWRDEISITLSPGEGAEVKLTMSEGATASFSWESNGGPVNYDTHGDGGGRSISYEKGRGVDSDAGELTAAFKGNHGWFFRNRNSADVTVVLRTDGEYGQMKRVL